MVCFSCRTCSIASRIIFALRVDEQFSWTNSRSNPKSITRSHPDTSRNFMRDERHVTSGAWNQPPMLEDYIPTCDARPFESAPSKTTRKELLVLARKQSFKDGCFLVHHPRIYHHLDRTLSCFWAQSAKPEMKRPPLATSSRKLGSPFPYSLPTLSSTRVIIFPTCPCICGLYSSTSTTIWEKVNLVVVIPHPELWQFSPARCPPCPQRVLLASSPPC
ncbi:hypothetical protein BDN72DRAFT_846463 [Pluteus cervinus]|uniref:Uncharacterized protein n=2 Tax=Pluteus cervinus TaxID=181527 RepID=A0ACD3A1C5_9AGAR|nr:hypothetical protein BDN72DRAFT_642028 [Pluteus cervinus]TFK64584.1 hypothetical protein BDN72DRAFT_846463 [Pluteus cervinus]